MTKHLHRDMTNVQREVLAMSALVEEMIDLAARSLIDSNIERADEVIAADRQVDRAEVKIEEECLKMLALHQPVAVDLRRIATVLKINNDLERVADLAVNIAQRARSIDEFPAFSIPLKLEQMVLEATRMVREALDSFVQLDARQARQVMKLDDSVDKLNVEVIEELQGVMQSNSDLVPPALHCFSAARHVERIADHATNICEDVIYLVEGDIVRHRHDVLEATP